MMPYSARLRAVAVMVAACIFVLPPAGAMAEVRTVADIRAELDLLGRQVQEIRDALVATGPAQGLPRSPATALQRVDQLEAELRRLTDRVDVLANDLDRVVRDASNRVDDIEFRLTELEGGDPSLLGGDGELLGGGLSGTAGAALEDAAGSAGAAGSNANTGVGLAAGIDGARGAGGPSIPPVANIIGAEPAAPAVAAEPGFPAPGGPSPSAPPAAPPAALAPEPGGEPQLAVSERQDFEAARDALEAGRHGEAARLLEAFLVAYPVGPFSAEAQHLKGEAMAAQGEWREAARTYLDAFSGAPDSPVAPRALHGLAVSLGQLGQTEEACLTLAEVDIRYPGSEVASDVAATRRSIGCR